MGEDYMHEPFNTMSRETLDLHRAIRSVIEELEAVDWYNQRMDGVNDEQLKAILKHNMDEEWEHCAMLLEWLRRNNKTFAEEMDDNWKSEGDIA